MGGYAPTMGIIGTVMGLVNVLQKLEDPSELGHSIAVAFIATLYGVGSANVLWLPLASKLKHKSAEIWTVTPSLAGTFRLQAVARDVDGRRSTTTVELRVRDASPPARTPTPAGQRSRWPPADAPDAPPPARSSFGRANLDRTTATTPQPVRSGSGQGRPA